SKTLGLIAKEIGPGVTTKYLDKLAEEYIRDNGGIPGFLGLYNFPATLCVSPNEEVVHGIPNDKPLEDGDIISVDCGVLMNGFYGDHAYSFEIGNISKEVKKLLAITKESLYKGIEQCRKGNRIGDISYAIQSHCEKEGYGVVRELCGHALGRGMHEDPAVPNFGRRGTEFDDLDVWKDIVIAYLSENGFDSFWETESGISAYAEINFDAENVLNNLISEYNLTSLKWNKKILEQINWNQEWEKHFEPINIDDKILVRADFHPENPFIQEEIIIQPKMSFGTGHHETTYLMLQNMINIDFKNKFVLDIGCGTGILAIYAKMKHAQNVIAIDNDQWAYANSIENAERNNLSFDIILGDFSKIQNEKFDIILANIN
ncbi:unnamed protein product, partial [Darwinula stevensoni]